MDNSEANTDMQLFKFREGKTILKGLLIILLILLTFIGFIAFYYKKYNNYYYTIFILAFIVFTILFDSYNVEKYGIYSISIIFNAIHCIYLYYYT